MSRAWCRWLRPRCCRTETRSRDQTSTRYGANHQLRKSPPPPTPTSLMVARAPRGARFYLGYELRAARSAFRCEDCNRIGIADLCSIPHRRRNAEAALVDMLVEHGSDFHVVARVREWRARRGAQTAAPWRRTSSWRDRENRVGSREIRRVSRREISQVGRVALALARLTFLANPGSRRYGGGSCNPSVMRSYFAPA